MPIEERFSKWGQVTFVISYKLCVQMTVSSIRNSVFVHVYTQNI